MSKKKIMVIVGVTLAGVISLACTSGGNDEAPRNADTVESGSAPETVAAVPVTVSGTGEGVQTVELVDSGYTVAYEAAGFCIIVTPIKADGSEGLSFINDCAATIGGPVSGTTVYNADGPVTVHVHNTSAAWTLTFTPLK